MLSKTCSIAKLMGCCSCFGFTRRRKTLVRPTPGFNNCLSQEPLLDGDLDYEDDCSYNDDVTSTGNCDENEEQSPGHGDENEAQSRAKRSEEILRFRLENGLICRQFPVKETHKLVRTEV